MSEFRPAIVLAHTAAPPYTRQTALAFTEADWLRLACIGLFTRDTDFLVRAAALLPGFQPLHQLLRRRLFEEVPALRQRRFSRYEWLRLLSGRLDRSGIVTDRLWDFGTRRFDAWSAGLLRAGDIAYGYEYGCLAFFKRAKQLDVPRIYEIPSAEHDYYHRLMQTELERFPDLRTPWHDATAIKQAERSQRRHDELALANRVIVYSSHVVESYRQSGFDTSQFRVVPLGAPAPTTSPMDKPDAGPLKLIWAGTFGIRKGAHYLIEALERFPEGQVTLDIFGSFSLSDSWRSRVNQVARFHGPIPYDRLLLHMRAAHALILPSLSEAFGMVVTEAMASGTPVLVSQSVGAADLVQPGSNGLVFEPGSAAAIKRAIETLLDQRQAMTAWGHAAQATAIENSWTAYRKKIVAICQEPFAHTNGTAS